MISDSSKLIFEIIQTNSLEYHYKDIRVEEIGVELSFKNKW